MTAIETTGQPHEVAAMQAIAASLTAASLLDRPAYNGMFISLPGTLSLAARSLREMAEKPDTDNEDVLESHENRCYESQPTLRAHGLEELGKHLGMLKKAIDAGDSITVRKFFEIYRFD